MLVMILMTNHHKEHGNPDFDGDSSKNNSHTSSHSIRLGARKRSNRGAWCVVRVFVVRHVRVCVRVFVFSCNHDVLLLGVKLIYYDDEFHGVCVCLCLCVCSTAH
jgi:hypothetical protein